MKLGETSGRVGLEVQEGEMGLKILRGGTRCEGLNWNAMTVEDVKKWLLPQ